MSRETMRLWLMLAGWMCFGFCAFAQPNTAVRQAPPPGWVTDGEIVRFKDGDTAVFEFKRQVVVRFADCWCGETNASDPVERKLGIEATQYVQTLRQQNPGTWRLEVPTEKMRDGDISDVQTLSRFVGLLYLPDGRCVNDLLVAMGLAGRTKAGLKAIIEERRK